jgi:hypothetical protein
MTPLERYERAWKTWMASIRERARSGMPREKARKLNMKDVDKLKLDSLSEAAMIERHGGTPKSVTLDVGPGTLSIPKDPEEK